MSTGTSSTTSTTVSANYTVIGMTCEHCVMSVTEEVREIEGVSDVRVDLASGAVTITSQAPLSTAVVRAAVAEAGYQLP